MVVYFGDVSGAVGPFRSTVKARITKLAVKTAVWLSLIASPKRAVPKIERPIDHEIDLPPKLKINRSGVNFHLILAPKGLESKKNNPGGGVNFSFGVHPRNLLRKPWIENFTP